MNVSLFTGYKITVCLSLTGIMQQFTCCCTTNCYGNWQQLLHFSWALKHLHFKLLHFFCKADSYIWQILVCQLLRASRSETCLFFLMSLSFSNYWRQRVNSARVCVYLLDRMPCRVAMM